MPKRLSQKQVDDFEHKGFISGIDVITADEAAAYRNRIEESDKKGGQGLIKTMRVKTHLMFPWMLNLARDPRVLDVVEDILGPNLLIFLSVLWDKKAGDQTYVSNHQDGTYYGFDKRGSVNLWLALTETNVANGCMRFYSGSHKNGILAHEELGGDKNLLSRGQTVHGFNDKVAENIILNPGQCSIHHENLVHGSYPNTGKDRRMGYAMVFIGTDVKPLLDRRSAFLVRGEDKFGYWDFDPEPRFDLDPIAMKAVAYAQSGYNDPTLKPPPAKEKN